MSDPIVITREIVKRGWTDFEPKVITGLLTGSAAAFVVSLAGMYGIHLAAQQQSLIAVGFYFLGSYLTPSSGQTFTRTISKDLQGLVQEVESHTGNTVTTVTGATPVQPAPDAVNLGRSTVTQILAGDAPADPDTDPTVAYGRGQAILNRLPSHNLTADS